MKVILLKDVAKVGLKGQIKEVSAGYAQNFLINRGLAEVATSAKVANAENQEAGRIAQQEAAKSAIEAGLKKLKGEAMTIRATANEKEHLFEAVSAETIAAHLKDVLDIAVEADTISIKEPIKALGNYTVHVTVGEGTVPVKISVESN